MWPSSGMLDGKLGVVLTPGGERRTRRIAYTAVPDWPPLAWLARCRPGRTTVDVFHGLRVEGTPQWFVEAVWADRYAEADFDRTDLVFGSGGRLRNGMLTFVSSGSTVDRLQFLRRREEV